MKNPLRELILLTVALSVIALDQVSKFFVRANMTQGQSVPEEGVFRITYSTNTGGVFGIFADQAFLITLAAIVGVVAIIVYSRYPLFNRPLIRIALGLLLGGAVGNLIDRIRLGEVTDFIDLGAWPVFNLADSAVVAGVILIIYFLLFSRKREAALTKDKRVEPEA